MTGEKKQDLVSIIIPAYNEETRIYSTLLEMSDFFFAVPHEILVVMDGCTDNTLDIVKEFSKDHPTVIPVPHPVRLGKGGGILLGVSKARGDVIAVVDADGAVPPADVGKMVTLISAGNECAISSRYIPGSIIHTYQPFHRVFASRCFNAMIRLLFALPYRDTQCGCKVIRADIFHEVAGKIHTFNYAFDVELLWRIRQHGHAVVEVPVEWRHMEGSKLELKKVIPQMFTAVIKLRFERKDLRQSGSD